MKTCLSRTNGKVAPTDRHGILQNTWQESHDENQVEHHQGQVDGCLQGSEEAEWWGIEEPLQKSGLGRPPDSG